MTKFLTKYSNIEVISMVHRLVASVLITLLLLLPTWSQVRERDPLTEKEVDQLRETAIEPEKRLKLMVEFTRARMVAIEQLRSDPKLAKERGQRTHDLLEDIATLVDEIDDNVENYNERSADLRKPLKQIVEMDTDFQLKLRELRAAADDPKNKDEAADYKFSLEDAIDSVNRSAESSRKLLEEHNVKFAKKKK
jgi:regulator of replication initiation timing